MVYGIFKEVTLTGCRVLLIVQGTQVLFLPASIAQVALTYDSFFVEAAREAAILLDHLVACAI